MVCEYPGSHKIWRAYLNGTEPQAKLEADKILVQWLGLERCFEDIERSESKLLRRYDWIFRTRTDLVYLSPIPLAEGGLPSTHAYLPAAGMTGWHQYQCMNDWMFLCPRPLCRRYFRLLDDLFRSQHCLGTAPASRREDTHTTSYPRGLVSVPTEAPTRPFMLPQPPGVMNAEWYFYARYGDGRVCGKGETPPQCCGSLREVKAWVTAIAVGTAQTGSIPCHKYLVDRTRSSIRRSFTRQFVPMCERINRHWAESCRSWKQTSPACVAGTLGMNQSL